MKEEEILDILKDWNFWLKEVDTGIQRESYIEMLEKFLEPNVVVCISGIRRSGKSFILKQLAKDLIRKGVKREEVLIVNFDDKRINDFSIKFLDKVYDTFQKSFLPSKSFIFLDEVHKVDGWERWVRTMNELRKAKIVVSGSTSKLLSKEYGTLLTGRHLDLTVFPLSFKEFLKFKNLEVENVLELLENRIKIRKLLDEYIKFGGFPEVVMAGDENIKVRLLESYFDDIINRDIMQRYEVRKTEELFALAKFYLTNISNLISFSSLEKKIGTSNDTIKVFSSYLEEVYLISTVKKFSTKVTDQERAPKKIYCSDTGLSNVVGFKVSENLGSLMENIVAVELMRRKEIYSSNFEIFYWKDYQQNEVDFILKRGPDIKQLIQVTYASEKDEIEWRELKALLKASDELKCDNLLIVTWDYEDEIKIEGKNIKCTPLWRWLLEL
jgi:predicted AAA+ superfamily ATPase